MGRITCWAMRLHADKVDPTVWDYESPVPVFSTGQEACDHGKRELDEPGKRAKSVVKRLMEKRGLT